MKVNLHQIWLISFGLVVISFFTPNKIQSTALIPFTTVSLIWLFKNKKAFLNVLSFNSSKALIAIFCLIGLSIFYSTNKTAGFDFLVRNLSLLAMPFLVFPITFSTFKERRVIFYLFQLSLITLGLLMIGNATLQYLSSGCAFTSPGASHFVYNIFMSHLLTDPFHIHPVYYSFLITIGSVSLMAFWHSKSHFKKWKWSFLFIATLLFHVVLIYLLKSALFSLLYSTSVVFAVIYQNHLRIFNSKTKLSMAILGVLLMALFSYKGAKEKLDNFSVNYEISNEHLSPMMMRFAIWECTWPIIKDNLLFGVGTGDQQDKLNQTYEENNFRIIVENNLQYNTHNQYLQYWLAIGLLGLFSFSSLILILLKKAFYSKNVVFIVFAFCFAIFSLNESTLQVQKGIVMFSVLAPLFSYLPKFWKFK